MPKSPIGRIIIQIWIWNQIKKPRRISSGSADLDDCHETLSRFMFDCPRFEEIRRKPATNSKRNVSYRDRALVHIVAPEMMWRIQLYPSAPTPFPEIIPWGLNLSRLLIRETRTSLATASFRMKMLGAPNFLLSSPFFSCNFSWSII